MNKRTPSRPAPIERETLLISGFKSYGFWDLAGTGVHLAGELPREPGVYSHVVDGKVCYIGRSLKGFRHRMSHYRKPGPTQSTSIRINGLIKQALQAGKSVETLGAFPEPSSWNGLPVDLVSGLETALVATFCPPWNKQGAGGKHG